jgi:cbb3-type cytochrome oxidase subunit 3
MFKQFTENINGHQVYLLCSLGIFLVFFIVVSIILFRLGKSHVDHMSGLPLNDGDADLSQNLSK